MFCHYFDIHLATKFGIDHAVLLSYIWENTKRSTANKSIYHEEKYWSKDNITALLELFPYFTEIRLLQILKKLSAEDLIFYKENPKKAGEIWYTLADTALQYFSKGTQIEKKTTPRKSIKAEKFSEVKDFKVYTAGKEANYFKIAFKFWKLWTAENPKSHTLKTADVNKWITAVRLIIETDKQDLRRLIGIYIYFQKCAQNEAGYDRFWFDTIKSISALRKKDKDDVYYLDRIIDKVNKKIEQSDSFYNEILKTEKEF